MMIMQVPKEIKEQILLEYVIACNEIYAIAFFQWRIWNPRGYKTDQKEMLTELLEERSKRALVTKSVDLVKKQKIDIKAN